MDRTAVTSESIAEIGYDPEFEILEIMFRNGRVYQYLNFPQFMYERFQQADSFGRFFNADIKGRYPESRV